MESQARVIEATGTGAELAPETVLPSQFFDRLQGDSSLQPEKRLMLAVLEDAVGTFQKYVNVRSRHGRRLFSEAEEWFASHDGDWPFAFVSVRFPFRRVNGSRHSVTGRPVGLRRSA